MQIHSTIGTNNLFIIHWSSTRPREAFLDKTKMIFANKISQNIGKYD